MNCLQVDEKHVFGLESPFKFRLTLQCLIEMKVPTNDSQGKKQFPNKEGWFNLPRK